jgi:hypothetical protein
MVGWRFAMNGHSLPDNRADDYLLTPLREDAGGRMWGAGRGNVRMPKRIFIV